MPLVIMENTCEDIASIQLGIVNVPIGKGLGILLLVPIRAWMYWITMASGLPETWAKVMDCAQGMRCSEPKIHKSLTKNTTNQVCLLQGPGCSAVGGHPAVVEIEAIAARIQRMTALH